MISNFPKWFKREYKKWCRSQPGEEDFLAFCDLLGHPPYKILSWLHGESVPQGPEVLSIAGLFGTEIYDTLDLPKPE